MRKNYKWLAAGLVVMIFVGAAAFWMLRPTDSREMATNATEITQKQAVVATKANQVASATVTLGDPAVVMEIDGATKSVILPTEQQTKFIDLLEQQDVPVSYEKAPPAPSRGFDWAGLFMMLIPITLICGVIIWSVRTATAGGAGKSTKKARIGTMPDTTLADVAGQPETVEQTREVLGLLREAEAFAKMGVVVPSGILLVGPPGNGKTLLARAVAGELKAPFFAAAGPDFVDKFVGAGAKAMRGIFREAAKAAEKHGHAIIFIDEIDSIGHKRTSGDGDGATREVENTLNALLVELDGFSGRNGVFVLAATNRPDLLDPALIRPGRFGKTITIALPDRRGREEIFRLYLDKRTDKGHLTADPTFDVSLFASRLTGMSAAEIEDLVAEAARVAASAGHEHLTVADFEDALGKIVLGPEKKSFVFTEDEKQLTAWHEAGHALAAYLEPFAENPVQVTIIPRGFAGGVTWLPPRETIYTTATHMRADMCVTMAGKAAEMILLNGDFSTGPGHDAQVATKLALEMVTTHGFSNLGSLNRTDLIRISDGIAEQVADEAQRLMDQGLERAQYLLNTHVDLMAAVANELIAKETLRTEDFHRIAEQFGVFQPKAPTVVDLRSTQALEA